MGSELKKCSDRSEEKRTPHRLTAALVTPLFLAGCGGEDLGGLIDIIGDGIDISGGSGGGSSGSTTLPYTTNETLLAFFLENLDSVRTAANTLITSDPRYTSQVDNSSYFDVNGNGSFDASVDIDLGGNPIQHSGIHYAHAAGLTGAGEVIAISDSGFLTSHEALAGKSITTGSGITVEDHGTFVASVAAGNSSDMIGVAPGADLVLGSFDSLSQLADTANAATTAGAVALNNSWGYDGSTATSASYNIYLGSSDGAAYVSALENYAQDGIVVFSLSNNSSTTEVDLLPGLPVLLPDLEESWLAVVNGFPTMSGDDVVSVSRISSACHEAAAWCITADGSWRGANSTANDGYHFATGTSFAGPTVSGALALLAEAFPDMTHQELRIRLLASADNEFSGFNSAGSVALVPGFNHEYSEEFGHGFLDVAAALLPIGQSTIVTINGTTLSPEVPLVVSGGASGDAMARALEGVEVASQDVLAATFAINAANLVATNAVKPMFSLNDVTRFETAHSRGVAGASFFGDGQDIALPGEDANYHLSIYRGLDNGAESFGVGIGRDYDLGIASLELNAAFGDDTADLLSDWNGGTDQSIFSAGMALTADLSELSTLKFEYGYATGRESSALGNSAQVLMNSAALTLSQDNAFVQNDRIKFSLSVPAAVTNGQTSVNLPVVGAAGTRSFQAVPIDLAPQKREMRFGVSYERAMSKGRHFGIAVAHAHNRGHIEGLRETAFLFSFNKSF